MGRANRLVTNIAGQRDRAARHGCIRLEKPAELAQWVLGWDATRVQCAMNGADDNKQVKASPKIPVYIVYFTTYFRDGQLFFSDDVYGRDDKSEQKQSAVAVTNTGGDWFVCSTVGGLK